MDNGLKNTKPRVLRGGLNLFALRESMASEIDKTDGLNLKATNLKIKKTGIKDTCSTWQRNIQTQTLRVENSSHCSGTLAQWDNPLPAESEKRIQII